MVRQSWGIAGAAVLLALLCLGLAGKADPPQPDKPQAGFIGKALFVRTKGDRGVVMLLDPQVQKLGDRTFVVGRPVDRRTEASRVWVPVSDVTEVEEFADAKEMAKWYRSGPPPHKK
jgi:hypothetical protein